MRLLLDANLSPSIAAGLNETGFEATHVGDAGLLTALDADIVEHARANHLVIVTVDSDFAAMLAIEGASSPSVVQLRDVAELGPPAHLVLLGAVAEELAVGATVSLGPTRLAVRRLPIRWDG